MKQKLFLICTYFSPLIGYSQKSIITNPKENVLYVGLTNPLQVMVKGYRCKDIILATDNGKIQPAEEACSYITIPEKTGFASVAVISKSTKKTIEVISLSVRDIPAPVAMVNRQSGGEIAKNVFKAQLGISADVLNMDIEARIIVTEFNMTVFRDNRVLESVYCNNNHFSDDVKYVISKIETGDKVVFSNIHYKNMMATGFLQPIEFKITE